MDPLFDGYTETTYDTDITVVLDDLTCYICGKSYDSKSNLNYHMKGHENKREFKCTYPNCDKSFNIKSRLTKHMSTHNDDKPFKCIDCGKCFKCKYNLKRHSKTHITDGVYNCRVTGCNEKFKNHKNLMSHMKNNHDYVKFHECGICGKRFTDRSNFNAHKRVHSDKRDFKCTFDGCDKKFKYKRSLTDHVKRCKRKREEEIDIECKRMKQ